MLLQFSPLEQFELFSILTLFKSNSFYFAFTNSTFFNCIILLFLILIMHFLKYNTKIVPTRGQSGATVRITIQLQKALKI